MARQYAKAGASTTLLSLLSLLLLILEQGRKKFAVILYILGVEFDQAAQGKSQKEGKEKANRNTTDRKISTKAENPGSSATNQNEEDTILISRIKKKSSKGDEPEKPEKKKKKESLDQQLKAAEALQEAMIGKNKT